MRNFALVAATVIVASFAANPTLAGSSADAARAWVARLADAPEWSASYRSITESNRGDEAILRGLTIRSEPVATTSIVIDTLTLRGFSVGTDGAIEAEQIEADHGSIAVGAYRVSFDDAGLDALELPSFAEIKADPEHMFSALVKSYSILAKAHLDHGHLGRLGIEQHLYGVDSTVSYKDLVVDRLADGKLDVMATGRVEVEGRSTSDQGQFHYLVDRIEARGFDIDAMAHVFDPDQYEDGVGDGVWRVAAGLVSYGGISVEVPDGSKISFGDMSMEDFRLRQPPKSFAPLFDQMLANPNMTETEISRLMSEHGLDLLSAFSIGRLSLDDFVASGFDKEGSGPQQVRLGSVVIDHASAESIREISLNDLKVNVPGKGAFGLDRFALGAITFPPLETIRAAILSGEAGDIVDPAPLIPHLASLELLGVGVALTDTPSGSLDRLRIDLADYVRAIPTNASSDLHGLELPVDVIPDETARKLISDLGFETLSLDYGYRIRWREADEKLIIENARLTIKDAGRISVDLVLGGLTRAMIEYPRDADAMLDGLSFEEMQVVFDDQSITDRAFAYFAKQQGTETDVLRQETADALPLSLRIAIKDGGLRAKLVPALKAFLLKPGRLTVKLRAKDPLTLKTLSEIVNTAPERLADMVDIDVTQE